MPGVDSSEDVKRLLILLLMKLGATSEEIALALQVDSSVVRRMLPGRKVKKIIGSKED
jgi:predicted transcriptional regulator